MTAPGRPWTAQAGPKTTQDDPGRPPRGLHDVPGRPQDGSRRAEEPPRRPQEAPRRTQEAPGRPQKAPGRLRLPAGTSQNDDFPSVFGHILTFPKVPPKPFQRRPQEAVRLGCEREAFRFPLYTLPPAASKPPFQRHLAELPPAGRLPDLQTTWEHASFRKSTTSTFR